ncbi:STE3-domain-containing protein [Tricholoma matsutake]|nr:STE3-domain-containing protein [Tricholoma matsutake 945]
MSSAPPNWLFSVFSFIGFIFCCIPFPWHLAASNMGTCLYMGWTALTCLAYFINSVVWRDNAINWAPVWCDLTSRLFMGYNYAIPAASLCMTRRLYRVAVIRKVVVTQAEKRREIIVDLVLCFVIPVLFMGLQLISEGHRFDIYEEFGCFFFNYNTTVGVVIMFVPPLLFGCACAVYSVLGVWAFNKSRLQFNEYLSNNHMTHHRYIRLMCVAAISGLATIILCSYNLYVTTAATQVLPWRGWADTHSDYRRVEQFPAMIWHLIPGKVLALELTRWLAVFAAFIFFAFFGFAEEARKNYSSAAQSIGKHVGITSTESTWLGPSISKSGMTSMGRSTTLPVFSRRSRTTSKSGTLDSVSDMTVSIQAVDDVLDSKEKTFPPDFSYGTMSLADVGGAVADCKADIHPFTHAHSPTSSTSSLSNPPVPPPALPHPSNSQADSTIEISSVRYLDANQGHHHNELDMV